MDTYIGNERRKDFVTRHAIDLIQTEPNRALDLFRAAHEMDEAETLAAIPAVPAPHCTPMPVLLFRAACMIVSFPLLMVYYKLIGKDTWL